MCACICARIVTSELACWSENKSIQYIVGGRVVVEVETDVGYDVIGDDGHTHAALTVNTRAANRQTGNNLTRQIDNHIVEFVDTSRKVKNQCDIQLRRKDFEQSRVELLNDRKKLQRREIRVLREKHLSNFDETKLCSII